jgi:hypothetical protein
MVGLEGPDLARVSCGCDQKLERSGPDGIETAAKSIPTFWAQYYTNLGFSVQPDSGNKPTERPDYPFDFGELPFAPYDTEEDGSVGWAP